MAEGSSEWMSATTSRTCPPSNELHWSDGDDSDCSLSTAVEDEESVEDEKPKDEDGAGNIPSAGDLEPWRPVSVAGRFKRRINSWRKCRMLGKGSYGDVFEVITDDGSYFAVKEISLSDHTDRSLGQLEQEISLLGQFEHENIVQYIGTDKDNEKLYIFLEIMTKGSLATLYRNHSLIESQVSAYTRQILNGLKYLHDKKVIHRDIKCANILVDASGSVKLADFGWAKATDMNAAKSLKGTLLWTAPEVFKNVNDGSYGLAADIWSLGCTVLEMLTRRGQYSDFEPEQALEKIRKGEPPSLPKYLSKDARDFIRRCLRRNPKNRPSAALLLDHPFVMKPPAFGFA
ncbi:mitogen-activated protein kinase kinase kinase 1-like isoform X2 [Eucalyptus grandis]|uniref:mitogen-activated protein kinase kinase kinase 1-like isoform X2 n=1 Tax=Eucalyptus grandis TaxID=71139 RepID=UPI00192EC890|nr:mitogen-activated protein kinase kinase kinase 1-like isoform X2 [Eucalyptus grandis]